MTTPQNTDQKNPVIKKLVIILFAGIAILAFSWAMLPQGYSSDTTKIGKGKPAIVIIYDANNAGSDHIMGSLTQVRGEFESQVEFILVDVNSPGGQDFANANAVPAASALFLSREGKRITVIYPPQETAVLNKIIRQAFNL
ncbi:hypothetical protein ACFL3U_06635 [Pseudomonadota bacterium]